MTYSALTAAAAISARESHDLPSRDSRPPARLARRLRDRHWTMLWLATAIVAASFLLRVGDAGRVAPIGLQRWPLPDLCGSHALFGVDCPGCGLTRSFIALAHGDLSASLHYHRIGWVLALAVLLQFPYRILSLRELQTGIVERSWPTWFGWALIAMLIGTWLGKTADLW